MRKYVILLGVFLTILLGSCKSDDDNEIMLDLSKVYGNWYLNGLCSEQNNIFFSEDRSYIELSSNNSDCSNNQFDTVRLTGTYTISGNDIDFLVQTSEIISEGTSTTNPLFVEIIKIHRKIIELTDESLIIEYKFIELGEERVITKYYIRS